MVEVLFNPTGEAYGVKASFESNDPDERARFVEFCKSLPAKTGGMINQVSGMDSERVATYVIDHWVKGYHRP